MSDPQDRFHEPEIKEGYGVFWSPVRWKAYKPGYTGKAKGRWQMMNEYGGWENCEKPNLIVSDPSQITINVEAAE